MWMRTCQECGYKGIAKRLPENPTEQQSNAYMNAKCRKCGSMGLDYGKEVDSPEQVK